MRQIAEETNNGFKLDQHELKELEESKYGFLAKGAFEHDFGGFLAQGDYSTIFKSRTDSKVCYRVAYSD